MILDELKNWKIYSGLGKRFEIGFEALASGISDKPDGKYELDGDRVFAIVQRYQTRAVENCKWEAHRKYIDIQFMSVGDERMGYGPVELMKVVDPYNATKDAMFLEYGEGDIVTVRAGMFAVFYPQDGHMPGMWVGGPSEIVKTVIKVAV